MDKKSMISNEQKDYIVKEFTNVLLQALKVTFEGLAKMCSGCQKSSQATSKENIDEN